MRMYTVEEARSILPEVIPVLEALREAFRGLRGLQAAIASHERGAQSDGSLLANPWDRGGKDRPRELEERLHHQVQRLNELGIEVKDPERGLIDFYSERDGEVVFLCYLLGEETIEYWHTLSGGFAGREPV